MKYLFIASLVIAAALGAAAPAWAQRASLADRVALLEQQASNNQANIDLLRQINQLKDEVQALRGQVEEMTNRQEQLASNARAQYLDLDSRIERIEGGGPGTVISTRPPAEGFLDAPDAPQAAPDVAVALPELATPDTAPAVYGDAGTLALGANEREAYDAAFAMLRAGDYTQSARLFLAFLDQHPNGSYAPNALYWLGESYYVTQNYERAQRQFQALMKRYPTHDKASGALLKVGLSQLGQRQIDAAERTLEEVVRQYPGTDAARVASDRLGAIQLGRLR
ncbi:MAG: tol-pal system protein YbgF [Pseudomonadota bacterium]|nr:tol-pal system protein YbgF [Pseudomonadota bacterium]